MNNSILNASGTVVHPAWTPAMCSIGGLPLKTVWSCTHVRRKSSDVSFSSRRGMLGSDVLETDLSQEDTSSSAEAK